MECAICGQESIGYWCSEDHLRRWNAERSERLPSRPLPRVLGTSAVRLPEGHTRAA